MDFQKHAAILLAKHPCLLYHVIFYQLHSQESSPPLFRSTTFAWEFNSWSWCGNALNHCMLFPDLLGALGVRMCKTLLQGAEVLVMNITENKEYTDPHTAQTKSQTLLSATQQEILSKTLMKSDEPFTAEALKCCVEASLATIYSNALALSPCTLGTKWCMEFLFVWSVSSLQPRSIPNWKYVSFSTYKILHTQTQGLSTQSF